MSKITNKIGVVVIGRNEGVRLKSCLKQLKRFDVPIVYVDSGSNDGSTQFAESIGVNVVNLDMSQPFTAARARNEGFSRLLNLPHQTDYVQFVDGDCEVVSSWFSNALSAFENNEQLAVVCGRRKERYPESSIYNFMCDREWDTPVGIAKACGGDSLMRVDAFRQVSGFNSDLIAGEEPELCVRLRSNGWVIERIDALMTMHDAAIFKFSQWWRRSNRAGYAFIAGASLHGTLPERYRVRETLRPWYWAFLLPVAIFLLFNINVALAMFVSLMYPLQILKQAIKFRALGYKLALTLAFYNLIGKFAELQGQFNFIVSLLARRKSKIIEYK